MSDNPVLNAVRYRVARQTDQLPALKRFYCEGIGLPILSEFNGHDGYDGLILGFPDAHHQLEFVQHEDGSPGESPNEENLLVFYLETQEQVEAVAQKLIDTGYPRVKTENPWWERHHAITIADPDGYRVVFVKG